MSKSKWKILIECDAVNIKEFETAFFENDETLTILRELIKGIICTDCGNEMD